MPAPIPLRGAAGLAELLKGRPETAAADGRPPAWRVPWAGLPKGPHNLGQYASLCSAYDATARGVFDLLLSCCYGRELRDARRALRLVSTCYQVSVECTVLRRLLPCAARVAPGCWLVARPWDKRGGLAPALLQRPHLAWHFPALPCSPIAGLKPALHSASSADLPPPPDPHHHVQNWETELGPLLALGEELGCPRVASWLDEYMQRAVLTVGV